MKANSNLLYISTSSIQTKDINEAVNQLSGITKNIELSGGCEYHEDLLEKLIKIKQEKNIHFLLHAYFPPPLKHFILNFSDKNEKTREFITEAMAYAKCLDIPYYSIHAFFKKILTFDNELLFESGNKKVGLEDVEGNTKWFLNEFPNTKLAIENLYPSNQSEEICFPVHSDEIVDYFEHNKNIFLLLDLGHLKISSKLLGFNYLNVVELLFEKYNNRILEIHLSENDAIHDNHFLIDSDSIQCIILKKYARIINQNKINVTIESRNSTVEDLVKCFILINDIIKLE